MAVRRLRNEMMDHLLDALDEGRDIGRYGRLVFVMVVRHFLDEEELVERLSKNEESSETSANSLVKQVSAKDYNSWYSRIFSRLDGKHDFPILLTPTTRTQATFTKS